MDDNRKKALAAALTQIEKQALIERRANKEERP